MSGKWSGGHVAFRTPIPHDLTTGARAKLVRTYNELEPRSRWTGKSLSVEEIIIQILYNTDVDVLLKTLGKVFTPRVVTVTTTPTRLIAPNKEPRGYILINPSLGVGLTQEVTALASAARAAGTFDSANINVGNFLTARAWLDVTANATPLTLQVDWQTRDPLSLNFATAQSDIFGGSNTVGTFYASVGQLGVDTISRVRAVVGAGAGTVTFSVSVLLKDGLPSTPTGQDPTIYLGGADVNTIHGFPLAPGAKESFFLLDNTTVFGVVASDSVDLKIFELQ